MPKKKRREGCGEGVRVLLFFLGGRGGCMERNRFAGIFKAHIQIVIILSTTKVQP